MFGMLELQGLKLDPALEMSHPIIETRSTQSSTVPEGKPGL